jgi:hypothetical protein
MSERYICNECYAHVEEGQQLTAPDPFRPGDMLVACPECREVNALRLCCDAPGCWSMVVAGTPTATGYRRTCHEHLPTTATAHVADKKGN